MQLAQRQKNTPSPSLALIKQERLIDNGMLHYEASIAGFSERYGRGESSHTIHVWWARRPHTAMRALVFASLCKNQTSASEKILHKIGNSVSISDSTISEARECLESQYAGKPRLLDMFGGGGTIPFEALNLGAETFSIDSNPLSVFIQRCNLVYSQQSEINDIETVLSDSGKRVLKKLQKETDDVFPLRKSDDVMSGNMPVMTYLWTYSYKCSECGFKFYLSKRPWLSKKKGKNLAFVFSDNNVTQKVSIEQVDNSYEFDKAWQGRSGSVVCPSCGKTHSDISIKNCQDEIVSIIRPARGTGKVFCGVEPGMIPDEGFMMKKQEGLLDELGTSLPKSLLPKWSGIINPALYGVETHAEFLNLRQRIVLLVLIKALREEYKSLVSKHGEASAKYVISLLSGLIDQLVDWNCRLSMWIPQNEQVGRGFCGPGVSMLWDYAETDPILNGPANLKKKLKRIIEGSKSSVHFTAEAHVYNAYAQELPFEDNFFDAIVSDPPYYDNIYYTALADFFFAWKRILFEEIDSELFSKDSTDTDRELVASKFRAGTADKAHERYCHELQLALKEVARVIKEDGVFSFVYSHSSANGWEALVRAYRNNALSITSVQPLSIERKQRPRAMTSQAVNTCITFIARKTAKPKEEMPFSQIKTSLSEWVHGDFSTSLLESGWTDEDAAMAVYAHGVAMLANCAKATGVDDDISALISLSDVVAERFSKFKVKKRRSL